MNKNLISRLTINTTYLHSERCHRDILSLYIKHKVTALTKVRLHFGHFYYIPAKSVFYRKHFLRRTLLSIEVNDIVNMRNMMTQSEIKIEKIEPTIKN